MFFIASGTKVAPFRSVQKEVLFTLLIEAHKYLALSTNSAKAPNRNSCVVLVERNKHFSIIRVFNALT